MDVGHGLLGTHSQACADWRTRLQLPVPRNDDESRALRQSHSRRLFSQSSKYLRAIARSASSACASALVYMSVIHVSSGFAPSLATMSQNSPSAAWRDTSSPLKSMLPSSACAR